MQQPFRYLEFQERIHRLVDVLSCDHPWKRDDLVKRHIDHGLVRRMYMLEHSIIVLAKLPPDGAEALPLHRVEDVNVAVNSLYLNMRGALDNAAWALLYHLHLIPDLDEGNQAHRRQADLFHNMFLKSLSLRDSELADRLRQLAPWGDALRSLRDPAAHRIPLYIPPSVLTEAEADEVSGIDREISAAAEKRSWDEFHALMMRRWNAGRFHQVLTLSEQERLALVSLPGVLNRDMGGMLDALELVVAFVFAAGTRPMATNCGPLPRRKDGRKAGSSSSGAG